MVKDHEVLMEKLKHLPRGVYFGQAEWRRHPGRKEWSQVVHDSLGHQQLPSALRVSQSRFLENSAVVAPAVGQNSSLAELAALARPPRGRGASLLIKQWNDARRKLDRYYLNLYKKL